VAAFIVAAMIRLGAVLLTVALVGPAPAFAVDRVSRPDFVASACRAYSNTNACGVALRYLAALDLDRFDEACALLEPETLEAAGGMAGCEKTLAPARGIRIRYSLTAVRRSPLGRTVFFSTRADRGSTIRQAMIVTPRGRILAVVPTP
jgi:hypothetical protein